MPRTSKAFNLSSPLSALAGDLAALAGERSSGKRVELLRRIADAYAAHAEPGMSAEQYLFNEVVAKLVDQIGGADRISASTKLAAMSNLPDGLVRKLATDANVEVAAPMLRDYAAISEPILIDVAKAGSQDHLRVLAARPLITPPVSEVVVERGDRSVVQVLADNQGAQFSDHGMCRMIDRSKSDTDLQGRLIEREDLSFAAIARLMPIITEELAKRLHHKVSKISETAVVQHLAEWIADRKKSVERTQAFIIGIRKGDLNVNDIIDQLLARCRLYDSATVLGAVLDLDGEYTFGILAGPSLQSAMLLMRAADLGWPTVDAFLRLREAKAGLYGYKTPPTRDDYDALDAGAAKRALRFIKVRSAIGAA